MIILRIIISAGGTGGHIYPALAILNKIKEKDKNSEILYIGTDNRMEKDIVPKQGYKFIGIRIDGLERKLSIKNIRNAVLFMKAVRKCKKIINDFKPDIVLGVGGYVSAPVVYAAHKLGVKCCIHEQNSSFAAQQGAQEAAAGAAALLLAAAAAQEAAQQAAAGALSAAQQTAQQAHKAAVGAALLLLLAVVLAAQHREQQRGRQGQQRGGLALGDAGGAGELVH